jgi:hypothetical protein
MFLQQTQKRLTLPKICCSLEELFENTRQYYVKLEKKI